MLLGFYWKLKLKTDQNASRKDSMFSLFKQNRD